MRVVLRQLPGHLALPPHTPEQDCDLGETGRIEHDITIFLGNTGVVRVADIDNDYANLTLLHELLACILELGPHPFLKHSLEFRVQALP